MNNTAWWTSAVSSTTASGIFSAVTPSAPIAWCRMNSCARPRLMISWIGAYYAASQPDASELGACLRHYTELGTRLAATMDIAGETSLATLVG